jgi:predicted transport protein
VDEYTIEHILPQNENLSSQWRGDLGPEWQRIQKTYLHTLGNLTLTGYNSEYSDRPFAEKRDMPGGFSKSPLRLNEMLRDCAMWNEASIRERAAGLAERATKVWTAPSLTPATLAAYQPKEEAPSKYSIADHPYLVSGAMREVFEAFRRTVLAIDPTVSEEFKKLYVAYKAETNFVDVIPQAKRLVLSLNIDPHALDDPRAIARDVTGLGRWGNGDVNVALAATDELPYVMGLVRQAFDQQMANGS